MKRVAALVLAAGRSLRMGAANKLLIDIEDVPMVARVAMAALSSRCDTVLVVTGHEAEAIRAAVADMDVRFAHNPGYAEGLGTSLAAGLAALPDGIDGALICLGDMPWVGAGVIDALIDAFENGEDHAICLPTHRGRRGNPVLWARRFFPEMQTIEGDKGARGLIDRHAELIHEVECDDSVLRDVDAPTDVSARSGP